jgi:hypothetical protein
MMIRGTHSAFAKDLPSLRAIKTSCEEVLMPMCDITLGRLVGTDLPGLQCIQVQCGTTWGLNICRIDVTLFQYNSVLVSRFCILRPRLGLRILKAGAVKSHTKAMAFRPSQAGTSLVMNL